VNSMMPPKPNQQTQQSVAQAVSDAQNIVDAAKARAEKIIKEAKQTAHSTREKGYQEGLNEGKMQAINSAVRLIKDHSQARKKMADEAAQLSYLILEKVFHLEAPQIINPIRELSKRLIGSVSIGKKIDLVIHPSNKGAIAGLERELTEIARDCELYIVEFKDMAKDSVLVKTDFGEIQVSLSELLSEICVQVGLSQTPIEG
jgi:flagellar biosynthesis/type III secretory pathway protein FliH